jgi:peptide deformylase
MAIRNIRIDEDPILRKRSREVTEINDRITELLDDMIETMYDSNGVGLAAPQVGILKRIAIVDVGEELIELINPVIIKEEGSQIESEGCLSLPGLSGKVERPFKVTVKAMNRNGEEFEIEGEELLARAFCHEIDHLNGILFKDKIVDGEELEVED